MSCDYAIWNTQTRLNSTEARHLYEALCDGDTSGVSPNIAVDACYVELTSLHPEPHDVAEEDVDNVDLCPWSTTINRSPGHLLLCCSWRKGRYVRNLLRSLSIKHNLTLCDPQDGRIYFPNVFYPDILTLTPEDEADKKSPTLADVQALITRMNLGQGPSFAILEGRGLDYAQFFGGRGVYTVEWREYSGVAFQHWTAGRGEQEDSDETFVQGPAYSVQVQPGERLSDADVLAISAAYLNG
jgi:hypothetical protein